MSPLSVELRGLRIGRIDRIDERRRPNGFRRFPITALTDALHRQLIVSDQRRRPRRRRTAQDEEKTMKRLTAIRLAVLM